MPRLGANGPLDVDSIRRTSERRQQQVDLGLQLCDSSELDAQLLFGTGKTLVNGPDRLGTGTASNRAAGIAPW